MLPPQTLKYCDKHNQVGFLRKPDESAGFAEIVDFLQSSNLRYALTTNPTIYDSLVKQFWQSATANTKADGTLEIKATIDTIRANQTLLPSMLLVATNPNAGQEHAVVAQSQPSSSSPQLTPTPPPIPTPTPPPIPTPTPPPITTTHHHHLSLQN
ncbi:hypothetical protein Tco_0365480 [Tanacetum coccineum]